MKTIINSLLFLPMIFMMSISIQANAQDRGTQINRLQFAEAGAISLEPGIPRTRSFAVAERIRGPETMGTYVKIIPGKKRFMKM